MISLTFWDIVLWLAVTAMILLATSELVSPHYGRTSLLIDKKKLRNVSLIVGFIFLIFAAFHIYQTILQSELH